jgi:hypothetical protein
VQPKSGYKTITPTEFSNVLFTISNNALSLKGMRVYFACFSLVAIREAANRSQNEKSKKRGGVTPSFRLKEISKLTGLSERIIKKELFTLKHLGILSFSDSEIVILKTSLTGSEDLLSMLSGNRSSKRPIPIPRSIIRFLAKCEKLSTAKALIAYLLRGLSLSRNGEIKGQGSVKCSWIAETIELSLRSVKSARKELLEIEIITPDTGSHQWKLNKTGAYFTINLNWKEHSGLSGNKKAEFKTPELIILCSNPVDNSESTPSHFAPPLSQKCTNFAPPYKDKKTPYGSKDQKSTSGLLTKRVGGGERKTTINNIVIEDLQSFYRTEELYRQAVKAHWIAASENNFLNWMAAAVRAKSQKDADQVRLFVAIIKRKLFHFITSEQEERARRAIQKFRYGAELTEEMRRLVA